VRILLEVDSDQHRSPRADLAARHLQECMRLFGREIADRRAWEVNDATSRAARSIDGKLQGPHEIACDAEYVEPWKRGREALCGRLQRGLRDIYRYVGRWTQPANQQPRLETLAAAVLDQLAALAREACDVLEVRARQRKLAAGRVVLLQAADRLEQATAFAVAEILRGKRFLRVR